MKLKLLSFSKTNPDVSEFNIEEAKLFSSKMAGVCYMQGDFESLLSEDIEKTNKRLTQVLNSGHHSVFDHYKLSFEFSNIPKIIAMIINNEKDYATSEKSGRYTQFDNLPVKEKELYDKWYKRLIPIISTKYPELYNENIANPYKNIEKLAQENARNFISIFTPVTNMVYTTSLRQLNYIIYMCGEYISNCEDNKFNQLLIPILTEFINLFKDYIIKNLQPLGKNRKLSLFGNNAYINAPDVFSYAYQTSYLASFPCVAQLQRHRSESVSIYLLPDFKFYVPEILENEQDILDWQEDANSVKDTFPQGTMVKVFQTGTLDTLILKARERICGHTQLETMRCTTNLLENFKDNSPFGEDITSITRDTKAKCTYAGGKCLSPCFMKSNQFLRKI